MSRFFAVALAAVFFVLATLLPAATQGPSMGMAPNNNSLQALYPGQYASVIRMGFAAQGDAPLLSYTWGSTNCDLPDNGAEVQPATGAGCWHAMFQGPPDARQWGLSLSNTPAGNAAAITAALSYTATIHGCAAVPATATPYAVAGTISVAGACLRGAGGESFSGTPSLGCQLQFTDTSGITVSGAGTELEDLSWCGNAATSAVATQTAGLAIASGSREFTLRNLYIQNFVVCRQITGAYGRNHEDNIHCADQALYPNLTNRYPLACVQSLPGAGSFAATRITSDECRYQSWGGPPATFTGNGVTTAFAIAAPPGGTGRLYAADGVKLRLGADNTLPNNFKAWTAPQAVCGADYTLWDISGSGGGGSGGIKLYCGSKTIQVTQGSNVATVVNCTGTACTGDIPAVASPWNILIASDHGLDIDPRVTAVTATTLTMTGPATMSDTLTVMLTQIGVANDGCGAAACGASLEARLATAPAAGTQVLLYWQDPFCAIAYDIQAGSDYLTVEPVHVGGCRTVLRYIGNAYGGIRFRPSYFEFQNELAEIGAQSYGVTLIFNNRINSPVPGAYAGSYGGMVAPWYVDKLAGATTITYNNRTSLYNGATAGGGWADYVAGSYYSPGPPGTAVSAAGVALTTLDRAECSPIVTGGAFRLTRMSVNVTAAGTAASLKIGLYASDPVTARPGKLLSTGIIALAGTGGQGGAMSDYIGSPGHYWECYVGTWTAAPSVLALQALTNGVQGAGAWLLGTPGGSGSNYFASQPQSVSYAAAGLYAAGLPAYLSGLTSDTANLQAAAISWQQGQLPP